MENNGSTDQTHSLSTNKNMQTIDLQLLTTCRLEDMADRVFYLRSVGLNEEADLLSREGLELAEAYDNEDTFLFVNGLSLT